jgi:hypothetical protein
MKNLLSLLMLGLLTSCASTHPGKIANTNKETSAIPLVVSVKNIEANSDEAFQLVEVTFENKSDKWLRIDKAKMVLDPNNKDNLSVVHGSDLSSWANAKLFELKKDKHNKAILQTLLLTGGAVAVHATDNTAAQVAGLTAMVGTTVWAVGDQIISARNYAQGADHIPNDHLEKSFSVPGKMFTRRWILFNKPSGQLLTKFVIEVKTIEGQGEVYVAEI